MGEIGELTGVALARCNGDAGVPRLVLEGFQLPRLVWCFDSLSLPPTAPVGHQKAAVGPKGQRICGYLKDMCILRYSAGRLVLWSRCLGWKCDPRFAEVPGSLPSRKMTAPAG